MAFLIPENLRSSKAVPAPHRNVAAALAMLDDSVTVWFEPPFDLDGERPDFVVLDPALGVVVVAVFAGRVLGALRGRIRIEADGEEREIDSPLDRTEQFGMSLRRLVADQATLAMVPVSGVVTFPDLRRDEAEALDIDSVVRLDHCLFRDDLDDAKRSGDGSTILRRFSAVLEGGLAEPLDAASEGQLRGLIHPEVVIQPAAIQGSLFGAAESQADVIKVMDRKQERMAKDLGDGHRVVRGVAGSGKTLVLLHRARLLARTMPASRILVTCFTRSLASRLRDLLSEHPNVEVVHLDRKLLEIVNETGDPVPSTLGREAYWAAVHERALEAIEAGDGPRYRAVLVDEAQDFDTTCLRCCRLLLEDPEGGDLVVVADSAQNIFRRNFTWKEAGIQAQGRSRILRVNYRNTREILTFAHGFLLAGGTVRLEEDPEVEDEGAIVPPEVAERSGPTPTVNVVRDVDAEIEAIVEQVSKWYRADARPQSIAVLAATESTDQLGDRVRRALDEAQIPTFWVTDRRHKEAKDLVGAALEPVLLSTIHSAKGLEFDKVVVAGLGGRTEHSHRKLLYVGFTRAVDELAVITTADNRYREAVEHAAAGAGG